MNCNKKSTPPGTVSYTHLDVYKRQYRTSGRFITEDKTMLRKMKEQQASRQIKEFIEKMRQLGYQDPEILSLIKETINGGGMQP